MTDRDSYGERKPTVAYFSKPVSPELFNPFLEENSCIQMAIDTQVLDPKQDPGNVYKYVYRLKFCEIDRFSTQADNMHKRCTKMLRWVEYEEAAPDFKQRSVINSTLRNRKRKFVKFPFKYKYLKQDVVLEVSSCLDVRNQKQNNAMREDNQSFDSENDIRNIETLLFKVAFPFEDFLHNQNKWIAPSLNLFSTCDDNSARVLAKEFRVTQKTLVSFCLQIPMLTGEN